MKIVLCHGCFRILHFGHLLHLREAAEMGDRLVVSITSSKFITKPSKNLFTDEQRAEMLRELRCVDDVFISDEPTGASAIILYRPQLYVKGIDYFGCGTIQKEYDACQMVGADIAYTHSKKFSVSEHIR